MNLTVGPLPPAVYWRRRALVLGAVLVLVLFLVAMCGGSGKSDPARSTTANDRPGAGASATSRSPTPTASTQPPIVGAPGGPTASASSPPSAAPTSAPPSEECTDAEIQLTPSIQKITGGTYPYQMTLRIRNVSTRTCKRDIGSGPQELHIVNASGQIVWSSDYCQTNPSSNVSTFGPNIESTFQLGWDGYVYKANCARDAKLADGPYQLVAKLDTKVSAPVAFTIGAK